MNFFLSQHSLGPEVSLQGPSLEDSVNPRRSAVHLSRFSAAVDICEPACSSWVSSTSVKLEVSAINFISINFLFPTWIFSNGQHVRPLNDEWRSISRDVDGFPITCRYTDKILIWFLICSLKSLLVHEAEDHTTTWWSWSRNLSTRLRARRASQKFVHNHGWERWALWDLHLVSRLSVPWILQLNLQMEQGVPILSRWLIFNKFKFVASSGMKFGRGFLLSRY